MNDRWLKVPIKNGREKNQANSENGKLQVCIGYISYKVCTKVSTTVIEVKEKFDNRKLRLGTMDPECQIINWKRL